MDHRMADDFKNDLKTHDSGPRDQGTPSSAKPHRRPAGKLEPPPGKTKKKARYYLVAVLVGVSLLLLVSATVFFQKQDLSFSLLSGHTGSTSKQKHYLRIGPMSATLSNQDIIKFSVEIDCGNDAAKERLSEMEPLLKNQILAVITAPGTAELFDAHKYEEIKTQIREHIQEGCKEPVVDVYFSEMRFF